MRDAELQAIATAVMLIKADNATRIDLGHNMMIYKVPSRSPEKYTIRLDIKVEKEKEEC